MATPLTPRDAVKLAAAAYVGAASTNLADFKGKADIPAGIEPVGELIKGRTGLPGGRLLNLRSLPLYRLSNFAVIMNLDAVGGTEKVVAIRGTQSDSPSDLVTDFRPPTVVPGPNGLPCHAGFYFTYNSVIDKIRAGLGAGKKVVHVVGHSLGGAVAALTALNLRLRGHDVYLYTFGAPRVGTLTFTTAFEMTLKNRIYRVHDYCDPIPMIPQYPFFHAPLVGQSYSIGGGRFLPSLERHALTNYSHQIGDLSWQALRTMYKDEGMKLDPSYWMKKAGEVSHIPGLPACGWALGKALNVILKAIVSILPAVFATALTAVDMLIWALLKVKDWKLSRWVAAWIETACRWLGRKVKTAWDNTTAFLRYVLDLLQRDLLATARKALQFAEQRQVYPHA